MCSSTLCVVTSSVVCLPPLLGGLGLICNTLLPMCSVHYTGRFNPRCPADVDLPTNGQLESHVTVPIIACLMLYQAHHTTYSICVQLLVHT